MKIRIFALAKQLGLDNKVLIDLCGQAGIDIKNSALASITEAERDTVLAFIKGQKVTSAPPEDAAPEVATPVREAVQTEKRVRAIRRGPVRKSTDADQIEVEVEAEAESAGVEPAVAVAEVESHEPPGDDEPDDGGSDGQLNDADPPPSETAESTEDSSNEADKSEDSESSEPEPSDPEPSDPEPSEPDAAASETEAPVSEPEADKLPVRGKAISRDDYVSATGSARPSMREMKPIGTIKESDRKKSSKSKPALPNIAAPPSYTPPIARTKKSADEPVQKPDMPLTAEILEQQSPLANRLRNKRDDDGGKQDGGRRNRSGGLIAKRRQERASAEQQQQERMRGRSRNRPRRRKQTGPIEHKTSAVVETPITVRSLSEALGRPAKSLLAILFKNGRMATINESLTEDDALELALELGVDLEIKRDRDLEMELVDLLDSEDAEETLQQRPPIVTILGHVDHGKTTLLDRIRSSNVVAGEAGGITQHIASYQVKHNGQPVTFVDTPGHAAFGEMRARGANVTDIIILVVSADDGVMPQTEECISHAKSTGVPIIVALNKIDLPGVNNEENINRILGQLSTHGIQPAEWQGDYDVIRTSGESGEGIEDLLETILLQAELNDFQANPDRPAVGVCLEAFRDEGRGALAWLMVQKGTLRVGDVVVCGEASGRIRALYNDRDEELEEAPPSMPIKVAGLDVVPGAGDHFYVMEDLDAAREVVEQRRHTGRTASLAGRGQPKKLEDILNAAREGEGVQDLQLIIKADTPGSIEALRGEIEKFEHPEVRVSILHTGVGGVNESDVYLASAAGAIIVAFHVIAEDRAEMLAEKEGVDVRRYDIIYEVTDHIKMALEGMLRPEKVQVTTGRALVLRTFHISRFGTIAGCRVLNGTISRDNRITVIRDQKILNDYRIASLKREKDDAKEVRDGMECGIRLDGYNDVREGDLLEAFRVDEVQRKLDD